MTEEGSVPAQNLEAEESVLGAMLLSPRAIAAVVEEMDGNDFYRASHGIIFRAAVDLDAKGFPVDAITLVDFLEERGQLKEIGGRVRVHELAALVPTTANAGHYARIVRELAVVRRLERAGHFMLSLARDRPGEVSELVEQAEEAVMDVARSRARREAVTVGEVVTPAYQRLVELSERGISPGLLSGYQDLDRLTAGFQDGNLITVAARPSMGKTAFVLGVCRHVAVREHKPVLLFTLEMNRVEVTHRLMAMEALVDSHKMRTGNLDVRDWQDLTTACTAIEKAPLLIDDASVATVSEVRGRARREKNRRPDLALVVVDYLQLMGMPDARGDNNRVQEVSAISRGLKQLAHDLDVPIIALSQLSRAVEQRHDKRPILSDLRESGSIEQDSDVVVFLYRDEYYHPEEVDQAGIAEVNVAKQRNGPTGTVKLAWVKRHARFSDLARTP